MALLVACNKDKKSETETVTDSTTVITETPKAEKQADTATSSFDPATIPVTTKDVGDFPYVTLPERLEFINGKGEQKIYDETFVPLNGIFVSVKGPVFNAGLDSKGEEPWSQAYAKDSYAKKITDLGAIKIFDDHIKKAELDRYEGKLGSTLDYWNDPVQVYVLKKKDGTIVYFQLVTNTAAGGIKISEAGELK